MSQFSDWHPLWRESIGELSRVEKLRQKIRTLWPGQIVRLSPVAALKGLFWLCPGSTSQAAEWSCLSLVLQDGRKKTLTQKNSEPSLKVLYWRSSTATVQLEEHFIYLLFMSFICGYFPVLIQSLRLWHHGYTSTEDGVVCKILSEPLHCVPEWLIKHRMLR